MDDIFNGYIKPSGRDLKSTSVERIILAEKI